MSRLVTAHRNHSWFPAWGLWAFGLGLTLVPVRGLGFGVLVAMSGESRLGVGSCWSLWFWVGEIGEAMASGGHFRVG